MKSMRLFIILGVAFVFTCVSCAKESEQTEIQKLITNGHEQSDQQVQQHIGQTEDKNKSLDEGSFFAAARLKSLLVRPMDKTGDRLLEYHVNLNYQCNDFYKAREEIVHIISQYGFIKSANTDVRHTARMFISAAIQSKDIYKFLLDMDKVGTLISENLRVNDLTEEMVIAQRRIRREEIRIDRQKKAIANVSAQSKNWKELEELISRNEDNFDQSEHTKWKVLDRVSWANVAISLEPYGSVHIPQYKKAFIWLLNVILWIPYALVYLTPVVLLGVVIWWKWGWVVSLFKRKNNNVQ
ncbi:MAG: DUF4349 domain-containing protein [Spirochaetes bacterium]|nr:DUF4349 domain-containing protein [Spirochaetota bacterium]